MAKASRAQDAPAKMGRPTLYRPEYADEMVAYFDATHKTGKFPMFSGFARSIGVDHDTLINWRDAHAEFFGAYKECKAIQEESLVGGALEGKFQQAFSIFTAKNVLGWRDKSEHEHTGKDGGAIETKQTVVKADDLSPEERQVLRNMIMARKKSE